MTRMGNDQMKNRKIENDPVATARGSDRKIMRGTMNRDELLQRGEQGGARLKFIIALVAFAIVIYAGYMYIPVAYDAYYFKDVMKNTVDMAAAQGRDTSWLTDQLKKTETDYHVPANAIIAPAQK